MLQSPLLPQQLTCRLPLSAYCRTSQVSKVRPELLESCS